MSEPALDYPRLLERVRAVVDDVRSHSSLRQQIDALGVTVCENAGVARFDAPHTIVTERAGRFRAGKIIICTGGVSRRLPIPGFDLTTTPTDAWHLTSVPPSMLVVGGGATGVQVASIFQAFGSKVDLFEAGPHILSTEDADVAAAVAEEFRRLGMGVHENFGRIESFERTTTGVRMNVIADGRRDRIDAAVAVVAAGWIADTAHLNLAAAGVDLDSRGFVRADQYLRTSTPHIFAAGDVTGRLMLVPSALQDGFIAATNAVLGPTTPVTEGVTTTASFTNPEYARVGATEAEARASSDALTVVVRFDSTIRTIIDGCTTGFCKLIVDRKTTKMLGCHVVGERAGEIAQFAALAIAAGLRMDQLMQIPLAFPTYTGNLAYAAAAVVKQLDHGGDGGRSQLIPG